MLFKQWDHQGCQRPKNGWRHLWIAPMYLLIFKSIQINTSWNVAYSITIIHTYTMIFLTTPSSFSVICQTIAKLLKKFIKICREHFAPYCGHILSKNCFLVRTNLGVTGWLWVLGSRVRIYTLVRWWWWVPGPGSGETGVVQVYTQLAVGWPGQVTSQDTARSMAWLALLHPTCGVLCKYQYQ